MKVITNHL